MIQTLEAIVDEAGNIKLLTEIHLQQRRRALVTILDEEPKEPYDAKVKLPTHEPVSDAEVLGVWADRTESAQEIARDIRNRNRQSK